MLYNYKISLITGIIGVIFLGVPAFITPYTFLSVCIGGVGGGFIGIACFIYNATESGVLLS